MQRLDCMEVKRYPVRFHYKPLNVTTGGGSDVRGEGYLTLEVGDLKLEVGELRSPGIPLI